jgi:hypothetical protein
MAQKPEVKFDKLFQKLYNTDLWLMAYESIAPAAGNMTKGVDDRTVDGMGIERIRAVVADLKASRYRPAPVRRTYIEKTNGKLRPIGIYVCQLKSVPHDGRKVTHLSLPKGGVIVEKWPI